MKKNLLTAIFVIASALSANAQNWFSDDVFNHLSVGITAETSGVGLDVATTVGSHLQLRAGVTVMPAIKFGTTVSAQGTNGWSWDYYDYIDYIDLEGKTGFTNGKLLVDFYPSRNSSFHVTAGAYFGGSKIIEAYNEEDGALLNYRNLFIGDYILEPDEEGNINAQIKTNSFKPYIGIGIGRAVAKRKNLSFQFDMGVQFWGKPKIMCNGNQLEASDLDDEGEFLDVVSNLRVYPVISFRLAGKIF